MSKIKWASLTTTSEPPRRRKASVVQHTNPSKEEWDAVKPRIKELYQDFGVPEVRDILASEGFIASDRQIRHRITTWNVRKYLKLTPKQWDFILDTVNKRSGEGKETAFRLRSTKSKIPSEKIQRTLTRKLQDGNIDHKSSSSQAARNSASSAGIVPYTPRASHGSTGVFMNSRSSGSKIIFSAPKIPPPVFRNPRVFSLDTPTLTSSFEQHFDTLQKNHADSRLAIRCDGISMVIFCVDCHIHTPFCGSMATDVPSFFSEYEQGHMLSQNHVGRVRIRVLGDPEPWEGRRELEERGLSCGHPFPAQHVHEIPACWSMGGCRWAQFKTVENSVLFLQKDAESGETAEQAIEIEYLADLLIPPPDVPDVLSLVTQLELFDAPGSYVNAYQRVEKWLNPSDTEEDGEICLTNAEHLHPDPSNDSIPRSVRPHPRDSLNYPMESPRPLVPPNFRPAVLSMVAENNSSEDTGVGNCYLNVDPRR